VTQWRKNHLSRELYNGSRLISRVERTVYCRELSHLAFLVHWFIPTLMYSVYSFLLSDAVRKRGSSRRPVSVHLSIRPSVCPSHLCIVSKRLKWSSKCFLGQVAPSVVFQPKRRYTECLLFTYNLHPFSVRQPHDIVGVSLLVSRAHRHPIQPMTCLCHKLF